MEVCLKLLSYRIEKQGVSILRHIDEDTPAIWMKTKQIQDEIIDVLEKPELAERDKVLATPTVAKVSPLPLRKIVGDLSYKEKVLAGLNLLN